MSQFIHQQMWWITEHTFKKFYFLGNNQWGYVKILMKCFVALKGIRAIVKWTDNKVLTRTFVWVESIQLRVGWEVGGRFMREGIYAYLRLIHVAVWQKPTQHCKAIILQLKINKSFKKCFSEEKRKIKSTWRISFFLRMPGVGVPFCRY